MSNMKFQNALSDHNHFIEVNNVAGLTITATNAVLNERYEIALFSYNNVISNKNKILSILKKYVVDNPTKKSK